MTRHHRAGQGHEADHEIDLDSPITQRESKLIADAFRKSDAAMIEIKTFEC